MELWNIWGELLLPTGRLDFGQSWQLLVILGLVLAAGKFAAKPTEEKLSGRTSPRLWLSRNRGFMGVWLLLVTAAILLEYSQAGALYFRFFAGLGGLWIIIGLSCSLFGERFWARSASFVLYSASFLYALSFVEGSYDAFRALSFSLGGLNISAWGISVGLIAFLLTLWLSLGIARIIEIQMQGVTRLSPSLRVLIVKIARIALIFIALVITLTSMGVNLTSLTVLGGAVGLGLGLGLQKVVSNFVSGIVLLLDNSVKPGDVIEVDGSYGWINNLRARYASVITRDGTEHLIPNEDLITLKVINWSFTDNLVRQKVPIGVSYKSDPHACIELILQATRGVERVLDQPKPVCLLKGFGDSSVDLELRFWIGDPANGVSNVRSAVLLRIWDAFKANGVEIPFPQRDLHIRSSETLTVRRNDPDPE